MSFSSKVSPRRRTYVRLIGEIARALHTALLEEGKTKGLTQSAIAEKLGKNKSVISRLFAGSSNMTLESLADLAFAMDRSVHVSLTPQSRPQGANQAPLHAPEVKVVPSVAGQPVPIDPRQTDSAVSKPVASYA